MHMVISTRRPCLCQVFLSIYTIEFVLKVYVLGLIKSPWGADAEMQARVQHTAGDATCNRRQRNRRQRDMQHATRATQHTAPKFRQPRRHRQPVPDTYNSHCACLNDPGGCLTQGYFTNGWNGIDFVILLIMYLSLILPEQEELRGLRGIRLIRLLRRAAEVGNAGSNPLRVLVGALASSIRRPSQSPFRNAASARADSLLGPAFRLRITPETMPR